MIKLVNHLTDNYSKHPESNNAKLLGLIDAELNELADVFAAIEASRDIDSASHATLDKAGKNVLEHRNGRSDEIYRDHIKIKIKANLSKGDIKTINEIAEFFLGDDLIGVEETWCNSEYNNEPAGLVVHLRPVFRTIPSALKRAVAGGVHLWWEVSMEDDVVALVTRPRSWLFDYPLANRVQMADRPGKLLHSDLRLRNRKRDWLFNYPLTNEIYPQEDRGTIEKQILHLQTLERAFLFGYPLCGTFIIGEEVA